MALRVDCPAALSVTFFSGYFVNIFPCEPLPLMAISLKSKSNDFLFALHPCDNNIPTVSASPFGLAVK